MIDILEFTDELSERFGDLSDAEVILAVEEYSGRRFDDKERDVIICSYDHGIKAAKELAKTWGVTF